MSAGGALKRAHRSGLAATLGGPAAILLSATAFGLTVVCARVAGTSGVSGADLSALRSLCLFGLIGAVAAATRASLAVPRAERATLLGFGVSGALVGVGYLSSVAYIPVGVAAMIFYVYPALIALATPIVDRRPLSRRTVVALAVAGAGLALAIASDPVGLDPRGVALAALACVAVAAQLFFGARAPGGGGIATMFWAQAIVAPIALALALALGVAPLPAWSAGAPAALLVVAFFCVAFLFQVIGLKTTRAAAAGVIYCFEPVVSILAAAWWLGERLAPAQYAGAALVIAGVAVEIAARAAPSKSRLNSPAPEPPAPIPPS